MVRGIAIAASLAQSAPRAPTDATAAPTRPAHGRDRPSHARGAEERRDTQRPAGQLRHMDEPDITGGRADERGRRQVHEAARDLCSRKHSQCQDYVCTVIGADNA